MIHRRDVHNAGDHHGRALDHGHIFNRIEPAGGQLTDIAAVNLVKRAMPIRRVAAVIGRPVDRGLDRRLTKRVYFASEDAPQQVNLAVRRADLCVKAAFVENDAA